MTRVGVIGGTVFFGKDWFENAEQRTVNTPMGDALVLAGDSFIFLPRHGLEEDKYVMPHRINHPANLLALKQLGVDAVIGINSCGSLNRNFKPGMIAVPEDFISFFAVPSIYQQTPGHVAPRLDEGLRGRLLNAARRAKKDVYDGGVYWQNTGPRLETRAEVRLIAQFADMVGMTLGSEAAVACELDMPYGSLCSIDNYAHGLVDEVLTEEQIRKGAARNAQTMVEIMQVFFEMYCRNEQNP